MLRKSFKTSSSVFTSRTIQLPSKRETFVSFCSFFMIILVILVNFMTCLLKSSGISKHYIIEFRQIPTSSGVAFKQAPSNQVFISLAKKCNNNGQA